MGDDQNEGEWRKRQLQSRTLPDSRRIARREFTSAVFVRKVQVLRTNKSRHDDGDLCDQLSILHLNLSQLAIAEQDSVSRCSL